MVRETRHLWVGNLPENVREEKIIEHFKRWVTIFSKRSSSNVVASDELWSSDWEKQKRATGVWLNTLNVCYNFYNNTAFELAGFDLAGFDAGYVSLLAFESRSCR